MGSNHDGKICRPSKTRGYWPCPIFQPHVCPTRERLQKKKLETMAIDNLKLPMPTNRTVAGPTFRKDGSKIVVEYDCEQNDGTTEWSKISFDDILAFEYRQIACCREEDVVGSQVIRCQNQSQHLSDVLCLWQKSVGWQEWQQKQGGAARFKQFTVFFDDAGCIDVVAASCSLADQEKMSEAVPTQQNPTTDNNESSQNSGE